MMLCGAARGGKEEAHDTRSSCQVPIVCPDIPGSIARGCKGLTTGADQQKLIEERIEQVFRIWDVDGDNYMCGLFFYILM